MSAPWTALILSSLLCGSLGQILTETLFINGEITAENDKLTAGTYCTWDGVNPDSIDIVLQINENNDTFVYNHPNGTASDELVKYECRLLDHAEFALLATLTEASAGCPTNNSFLRLAAEMPSPPDPIEMEKYRTHQITLQGIDVSDVNDLSSVDCGGYHDGDFVRYVAACKRNFDFDSWSDVLIEFTINHVNCFTNPQTVGPFTVEDPSNTNLKRRYSVSFDMYKSSSERDVDSLNAALITAEQPKSDPADRVDGNGVSLGDPIYLEACISLANERKYFVEGASAMGVKLINCVASPDNSANVLPGTPTSVPVSNDNGCGLGALPVKEWATDEYVFRYGRGGALENEPYLQAPNCFRSVIFQAVSFARVNIAQNSAVVYSCSVRYCFNSSDPDCFGPDGSGTSQYPTCPAVSRKRRNSEYDVLIENLPSTVSVSIKINTDTQEQPSGANKYDDCFDKPTFFALLAVLLTIVLLFVCADVYMGVQMRRHGSRAQSNSSGSSASVGSRRKIF